MLNPFAANGAVLLAAVRTGRNWLAAIPIHLKLGIYVTKELILGYMSALEAGDTETVIAI